MPKLSLNKLSELTGFTRRTVKQRLDTLKPEVEGRAHLYESREALSLLYGSATAESTDFDLTQERARLAHHQANNESLKEQQLRWQLIPENVVREYSSGMVAAFRAKILSLHNKIRNRYPGLRKEILDEIQELHNEALSELGEDGIPSEIRDNIHRNLQDSETAA